MEIQENTNTTLTKPTGTREAITLDESRRLIELETVISARVRAFIETADALTEIRDARLYRADYETFEEYCSEKWGFTKQHAYRLIACGPIAKSNPQVTSLNQARALMTVPEHERAAVVEAAAKKAESVGREMETKDIRDVVAQERDRTDNRAVSEVVAEVSAAPREIRSQAKRWYAKAPPRVRANFLRLVFMYPVQTDDLANFKKIVAEWLENRVSEAKKPA